VSISLICDASPLPLRAAARGDDLPDWLDLSVADDCLIAAALLLQSAHPGSALHVATSDINLRTKHAAVALPVVDAPDLA